MAATVYKARVWEVAAVTGTGTITLAGSAQPGYRAFSSCVPSSSLVAYCIYDATAQAWETGIGIFTITATPAGTLTRGLSESSTGSPIDFIGNPCNVTLEMISPVQTSAGAASAGLIPVLNTYGAIDSSMLQGGGTLALNNIVQSNQARGGGDLSCSLLNMPTVGHIMVAFGVMGNGLSNPNFNSPFENSSGNNNQCMAAFAPMTSSLASAPTATMASNNDDAVVAVAEISGGSVISMNNYSTSLSGLAITSGDIATNVGDLVIGVFGTYMTAGADTITWLDPVGCAIVQQGSHAGSGPDAANLCVVAGIATSSSTSFGVSISSNPGSDIGLLGFNALVIRGASIAQYGFPLELNGTTEAGYQNLVVNTGTGDTTASFSGNTLTLSLP